MKLGLFIILFVIIFGGSYIVTNKLNGTSAYVDETAQLVKDNQDDVVSRLEAKEQGMYYFGFPTCPWCVELLPVLDKEDKLYVPFVVAINSSGDVKVHVGMVDDHDATKDKMTKDQEQRLVKILDKMIAFSQS